MMRLAALAALVGVAFVSYDYRKAFLENVRDQFAEHSSPPRNSLGPPPPTALLITSSQAPVIAEMSQTQQDSPDQHAEGETEVDLGGAETEETAVCDMMAAKEPAMPVAENTKANPWKDKARKADNGPGSWTSSSATTEPDSADTWAKISHFMAVLWRKVVKPILTTDYFLTFAFTVALLQKIYKCIFGQGRENRAANERPHGRRVLSPQALCMPTDVYRILYEEMPAIPGFEFLANEIPTEAELWEHTLLDYLRHVREHFAAALPVPNSQTLPEEDASAAPPADDLRGASLATTSAVRPYSAAELVIPQYRGGLEASTEVISGDRPTLDDGDSRSATRRPRASSFPRTAQKTPFKHGRLTEKSDDPSPNNSNSTGGPVDTAWETWLSRGRRDEVISVRENTEPLL